jgi:Xaa-Pro aminopeptidase
MADEARSVISIEEYRDRLVRIQASMKEHGYGALILFADPIRSSNVRYLVDFRPIDGVSDITWAVLIVPAEGEPTLFTSMMNILWAREVAWFGAKEFSELSASLAALRAANPDSLGKVGVVGEYFMPVSIYDIIHGAFGLSSVKLAPAEHVLAPIKAKKSPREKELLRRAGELTAVGLDAIKAAVLASGSKTEREVALYATAEIIRHGGDGPTFDIQIQSGIHASYNNIRSTNREVRPGDSLLLEMGARYQGHCTDIGRGAIYGPPTDPRQLEVIEASTRAVEAGIAAIRPGMLARDLNAVIEKQLVEDGFLEFSGEARGYGTGHGIGTDVEEEEPWIRPGSDFVLEEDMAMALKASIFIPGVAGVRTEENLFVTPDGAEVYTPYPRVNQW